MYRFIYEVGAGSAGAVTAARLSENQDVQVLLLDAGQVEFPMADIPVNSMMLINSEVDWKFETEPQQYCCNNSVGLCHYTLDKLQTVFHFASK